MTMTSKPQDPFWALIENVVAVVPFVRYAVVMVWELLEAAVKTVATVASIPVLLAISVFGWVVLVVFDLYLKVFGATTVVQLGKKQRTSGFKENISKSARSGLSWF